MREHLYAEKGMGSNKDGDVFQLRECKFAISIFVNFSHLISQLKPSKIFTQFRGKCREKRSIFDQVCELALTGTNFFPICEMFSQAINQMIRNVNFTCSKPTKISKFKLLTLRITSRKLNRKHSVRVAWVLNNRCNSNLTKKNRSCLLAKRREKSA